MKDDRSASGKSYHAIADDLIQKIESGVFPEGKYLPIEKDLISEYGVTRTTVRRALAALVEDGYGQLVPNKGVVALRKHKTGTKAIGFIDGSSIVLRLLYSKLSAAFLNEGYHLVHIDSQVIGLENALLFAQEHQFESAFVWSFDGFPDSDLLKRVQEKLPIVVLDHSIRGVETDLVTFDYLQMAHQVVDHLIQQGCKRVTVTGMLDMLDTTHDRFSGYLSALFANHMTPTVRDFNFCYTSGYGEPNYDQLISRLKSADRPDAIFVMQDEFVPGVVECILQCGLSISEDVRVATIGDDVVVSVGGQGITAVHCDWDAFALDAMKLMLKRMRDPMGKRERLIGKYELVPGEIREAKAMGGHAQSLVVTSRRRRGMADPS
jgi:DNA-binding LacI/PurR family transcriptional regulator